MRKTARKYSNVSLAALACAVSTVTLGGQSAKAMTLPPLTTSGFSGCCSLGAFGVGGITVVVTGTPEPSVFVSFADPGGYNGGGALENLSYYFELVGPSASVPIDLTYNVDFTATGGLGPAGGSYANVQINSDCINVPTDCAAYNSIAGSSAPFATDLSGVLKSTVQSNEPNFVLLNAAVGEGEPSPPTTITALVDPTISIDPSFAATDPNYLRDYSIAFSDGIGNGAVPEPATWTMMLFGVGLVGAGLRTSRRKYIKALIPA